MNQVERSQKFTGSPKPTEHISPTYRDLQLQMLKGQIFHLMSKNKW